MQQSFTLLVQQQEPCNTRCIKYINNFKKVNPGSLTLIRLRKDALCSRDRTLYWTFSQPRVGAASPALRLGTSYSIMWLQLSSPGGVFLQFQPLHGLPISPTCGLQETPIREDSTGSIGICIKNSARWSASAQMRL